MLQSDHSDSACDRCRDVAGGAAHPDGGDMIAVADTVTSFRELQ
jgi:hypothetical protein